MIKEWLISNSEIHLEELSKFIDGKGYYLYADKKNIVTFPDGVSILINGYFVPRANLTSKYTERQEALVHKMYNDFGTDFSKYGKGCYNIIIIDNDEFHIVSDRFGQIKHFIFEDNQRFIFSNSLKRISLQIDAQIDYLSLAVHTLFCHYIGGLTLLKRVRYNDAAGMISYANNGIKHSRYDVIDRLFEQVRRDVPVNEIADVFAKAVADITSRLDVKDVSLSLTGGMDTRNLLASLSKQNLKPHVYTYGNPNSEDSLRSQDISHGLKLEHSLYDYKPEFEEFKAYAKRIIKVGETLTSIHRVHRIWSVEKEADYSKNMFLGTLGGEYVKGVHFNDYIISKFIDKYWDCDDRKALLHEELDKKCFNVALIDLDALVTFVDQQSFCSYKDRNKNIFHVLSYITARTHDAQDINIYNGDMDYVFTPFLDIDYLEILFSSRFTFDLKYQIKSKLQQRLSNPIYSTQMIYGMYPKLAKFEYAGKYSPKEMHISPYYAMVLKVMRTKLRKKYPENFPLDQWMQDFVKIVYDSELGSEMGKVFDVDKLKKVLRSNDHKTTEAYWLKFTNVIHHQYELDYLSLED